MFDSLFFKCKRKFERDCKEADRAQQYFEKMDADINVTKADVEKVCVISAPCRSHQSHELVLYPPCLTLLPGLPHHPTMHPPLSLAIFFYILFPPLCPDSSCHRAQQRLSDHVFVASGCV